MRNAVWLTMTTLIIDYYRYKLTFTELRERDGPIIDLIRTRPDVQTGFVANSHRGHFR